ncbi:hypothetical protein IWX76_001670 [Pedobacter sp. CAN_A7]|uniref:glycosyltransferase n=1 Tax=Pedobacter sp. CAN_A7 TaxID=2787722 RepID=UPI0018C9BAA7
MTLFFTISTTNYLPFAVSLLDSVREFHPEFEFCVCLTDYLDVNQIKEHSLSTRYPLLQLHELGVEEFDFITQNYTPMQLANSSKILFARHFLNQEKIDQIIFADADMLFFNRLPEEVIDDQQIIFTPHFSSPPPIDMKRQELEVLNAGLYNGGFFKLKKSNETELFITWLRERAVLDCIYDFSRGYYGEQLWLNFIPLYFKYAHIEPSVGLNVAYWNLHERRITERDGQFVVNNTIPLYFFHFSGWDFNNPLQISKWALFNTQMRPDIIPLLSKYHERLKNNEYQRYINLPNYYTTKNTSFLARIKKFLKLTA